MKTFDELKEKITPEFIKKLCEFAEGFEYEGEKEIFFNGLRIDRNILFFPLLLHRAVEGWNHDEDTPYYIQIDPHRISYVGTMYLFKDYRPCHLTACEMAILDCLLEIIK